MPQQDQLRNWFLGKREAKLSFDDLWKIFLVRICDRAAEGLNEDGNRARSRSRPYFYDLRKIAEDDQIPIDRKLIPKIVDHLVNSGFGRGTKRSATMLAPTYEGNEKAVELLNSEIFVPLPDTNIWALGAEEELTDWLLVHALNSGNRFNTAGLINFRKLADHHPRTIRNTELKSALDKLERDDYVMSDVGPDKGRYWAYFNSAGAERAHWLMATWTARLPAPASNRFVRLDDNSASYDAAIAKLEELIAEAKKIRINDWPEKEGMLATLSGALEAIRTKYVNKTTILAAVSSVTTFIVMKFAEAPIAELASKAWNAVKALF